MTPGADAGGARPSPRDRRAARQRSATLSILTLHAGPRLVGETDGRPQSDAPALIVEPGSAMIVAARSILGAIPRRWRRRT